MCSVYVCSSCIWVDNFGFYQSKNHQDKPQNQWPTQFNSIHYQCGLFSTGRRPLCHLADCVDDVGGSRIVYAVVAQLPHKCHVCWQTNPKKNSRCIHCTFRLIFLVLYLIFNTAWSNAVCKLCIQRQCFTAISRRVFRAKFQCDSCVTLGSRRVSQCIINRS